MSDAAYMDAVRRGDMATAQRMVDAAAKKAGFTSGPWYHGTLGRFNRFNENQISHTGFHFGNESTARKFSGDKGDLISVYLNIQKPLRLPDLGEWSGDDFLATFRRIFKNTSEPITKDEAEMLRDVDSPSNGDIFDIIYKRGYDGIVYSNSAEGDGRDSMMVLDSFQIKSADPVTYDDAGNVIPLSQRFSDQSDDIRNPKRQIKHGLRNPVKVIERTDIGRNIDFATIPNDAEAKAALVEANGNKIVGGRREGDRIIGGKPIGDLYGKARSLPKGTVVDLRIDIPTFNRKGVYVVTVHKPKTKAGGPGDVIGYENIGRVSDPVFIVGKEVKAIYEGRSAKFPVATVHGKFDPRRTIPDDIENWIPVGMDPKEHAFFYDKRTDRPVVAGKEAISVGNTVFVKGPVYGSREDFPNPRKNPVFYPKDDITFAAQTPTRANKDIAASRALWETPAFQKWFGQSKVRNLAGKPAVLYHGTCASGFTMFDPTKTREMGFHFGTSSQAKDFLKGCGTSRGGKPGIYPVYLSIQNPIFTPDVYSEDPTYFIEWLEKTNHIHEWFPDEDDSYYRSLNKLRSKLVEAKLLPGREGYDARQPIYKTIWGLLRKVVTRKGYDGVRYKNENEGNTDDPYNIAWIAFSPAQVKSATENRGTFNRRDPDLRNPKRPMIRNVLSRIIEPGDRILCYDRAQGEDLYRLWDMIHTAKPLTKEALMEIEGMLDDDGVLVIESGDEPPGLRDHFRKVIKYGGMLLVQGPMNPEEARINTEKLRRDLE